jgi:hypothetical protein
MDFCKVGVGIRVKVYVGGVVGAHAKKTVYSLQNRLLAQEAQNWSWTGTQPVLAPGWVSESDVGI